MEFSNIIINSKKPAFLFLKILKNFQTKLNFLNKTSNFSLEIMAKLVLNTYSGKKL